MATGRPRQRPNLLVCESVWPERQDGPTVTYCWVEVLVVDNQTGADAWVVHLVAVSVRGFWSAAVRFLGLTLSCICLFPESVHTNNVINFTEELKNLFSGHHT